VLASQGQVAAAAEHFEEASRLFPRDAGGAFEAARAAMQLGRLDRADSLLTVAYEAAPTRAELLMARGEVRLALGDNVAALQDGRAAVALSPDSLTGWAIVAAASRRLADLASAEWALRHGIALAPTRWELRAGLADLLLQRGDSVQARVQADSAVALSRGAPPAVALRDRARGDGPARNDSLSAGRLRS
jgi:tetratricopeptide (TPR) repeat protein